VFRAPVTYTFVVFAIYIRTAKSIKILTVSLFTNNRRIYQFWWRKRRRRLHGTDRRRRRRLRFTFEEFHLNIIIPKLIFWFFLIKLCSTFLIYAMILSVINGGYLDE
jgi:hypothetical protein